MTTNTAGSPRPDRRPDALTPPSVVVRDQLMTHGPDRGAELLPAGTYSWQVELSWPARAQEVREMHRARLEIGDPYFASWGGTLALERPTPRASIGEALWRTLTCETSIPDMTKVTKFTLTPTGGA